MNCKNCKKQGCSLAGKSHEMSFECKAYVGKTNADRIRSMSDEELASKLASFRCPFDSCFPEGGENCKKCWLDWLKQEAQDG